MSCHIIQREEMKVVGLEMPEAAKNPELILYLWISFCSKVEKIKHRVNPDLLYGIWHKKTDDPDEIPSYLVAAEVSLFEEIPERMVAMTVPSGRYAMIIQKGHTDFGRSYDNLVQWIDKSEYNFPEHDAPSLEIYDNAWEVSPKYEVHICEPVR